MGFNIWHDFADYICVKLIDLLNGGPDKQEHLLFIILSFASLEMLVFACSWAVMLDHLL